MSEETTDKVIKKDTGETVAEEATETATPETEAPAEEASPTVAEE